MWQTPAYAQQNDNTERKLSYTAEATAHGPFSDIHSFTSITYFCSTTAYEWAEKNLLALKKDPNA